MQETAAKIACSAHIDTKKIEHGRNFAPRAARLQDHLRGQQAGKRLRLLRGHPLRPFLFFLRSMHYRADLIGFLEENRSKLDHLEFDVGIDYRMEGDKLMVLKSGYYGTF